MNLTGAGEPERLAGSKVSALFFATLGVAPLHGRVFRPEEDAKGHDHEVVLSYGLWQRDFGGEGVRRRQAGVAERRERTTSSA